MSTSEFYGDTSGIIFHSLLLDTILPGYRCLSASTIDEDPTSAMLGESSGRTDGPGSAGSRASGVPMTGFLGLGPRPHSGEFFAMLIDLPTEDQAEQMWEFFERRTYPIYPFLDMDAIRASYRHLLNETRSSRFGDARSMSSRARGDLTRAEIQPVLALHFLVFALVQSLSDIDLGGKEGEPRLNTFFS